MSRLTMLQSKISKTKKRLSDDRWLMPIIIFSFLTLLFIANSAIRALTLSMSYGAVDLEIPLMPVPFEDPSYRQYAEKAKRMITADTTAIIIKTNGDMVFGDLDAFGENFHLTRNKFLIRSVQGEPQIKDLLEGIRNWHFQRMSAKRIKNDQMAVLLPASTIPASIVIQIVQHLKESPHFDKVFLANGLM